MHCMRYVCCARRAALLESIRMCMYVSEFNLRCVCALYVNVCNTMYSFRIQLLRMHSYRLRMQQYVLVLNFRANYTCNSRKLHISPLPSLDEPVEHTVARTSLRGVSPTEYTYPPVPCLTPAALRAAGKVAANGTGGGNSTALVVTAFADRSGLAKAKMAVCIANAGRMHACTAR